MSLLSRLAVSAARAYGVLSKGGVSADFLVVAGGGGGGFVQQVMVLVLVLVLEVTKLPLQHYQH
jgi:uncharacterized membrane protein